MIKETWVISKERCPACAKQGNDTRGDNLAVYNDGHKYCFGCGYRLYSRNKRSAPRREAQTKYDFNIPEDASTDISFEAHHWLSSKCHMTLMDIISNKILWSESLKWLIFPIEQNGISYGFQARNFNKEKPYKWFTKFPKRDIFKVFIPARERKTPSITLVEDIVSGIRCGNVSSCSPLFGSVVSDALLLKIKQAGYTKINIWLDRDKRKDALKYAQRARELGLEAHVISTYLDPKGYTNEEIEEILLLKSR